MVENESKWLADLTEGNYFGELSLLNDSPRSANVIAKVSCFYLDGCEMFGDE